MTARLCLTTILVAGLVGSVAAQAPPTPLDPKESARLRWETFLKQAFRGMPLSVAADVDPSASLPPVVGYPKAEPDSWARLMGAILGRAPLVSTTTQVYARRLGVKSSTANNRAAVAKWLSEVDSEELRKLCGEGMAYSEMSPSTQSLFARLCDNPGLRQKMASGEFSRATVRMRSFAKASDRNGKTKYLSTDAFARDSEVEEAARRKMELAHPDPKPAVSKLPDPPVGPLDFADGELLTLAQALQKATKTFSTGYEYDGRLGESMVFWKGRFTKATFDAALREISKTIDAEPARLDKGAAALEDRLRNQISALLDPAFASKNVDQKDTLNGRKMSFDELSPHVPNWNKIVEANNIDPHSDFTLVPVLSLTLVSSGSYKQPDRPNESPLGNRWSIVFLP